MSKLMLHVVAPTRLGNCSIIVGDRAALLSLRDALDEALSVGSGGSGLLCSDGESHAVAVALVEDMYPVYTSYANELNPRRSKREQVPIKSVLNVQDAIKKARNQCWDLLQPETC